MFWKLDHHSYSPWSCPGRHLLRLFRILAEGERPARQYAILECSGLWNYRGCYRDLLVAPCYLLSLGNLRGAQGNCRLLHKLQSFSEEITGNNQKFSEVAYAAPYKAKERSFAPSLFSFCHSLLSLLFDSLALLSSFFSFFSGLLSSDLLSCDDLLPEEDL